MFGYWEGGRKGRSGERKSKWQEIGRPAEEEEEEEEEKRERERAVGVV